MEHIVSPKVINEHVEKLLALMNAVMEPEIVPVEVDPTGKLANCYGNVLDKVSRDGGRIHYGWVIWQSKNLCEAEHHAVWEDSAGDLHDITPRSENIDKIMFLPDENKPYRGNTIDNFRLNISGNPVIDDFIYVCEVVEKLFTYATRKNNEEVAVPSDLAQHINMYQIIKSNLLHFADNGCKLGSRCFCGSIKSYTSCCRKNLRQIANRILREVHQQFSQ